MRSPSRLDTSLRDQQVEDAAFSSDDTVRHGAGIDDGWTPGVQDDSDAAPGADYGEGSFFIDDLPHRPARRRGTTSEEPDSERGSERSSTPQDSRRKIAARMMPAFMLKRLEREAVEKERKKQEKLRRDTRRPPSPARPGHAVTRRGGGRIEGDDLFDFVDPDSDSDDFDLDLGRSRSNTPVPLRQRELIVISDDSEGYSSASQAMEDRTAAQSLARLYEGDFETIIKGRKPRTGAMTSTKRHRSDNATRKRRPKRPALGLAKKGQSAPKVGTRTSSTRNTLRQTRLDLGNEERSPSIRHSASAKKRKQYGAGANGAGNVSWTNRPAIRLDDRIIFSNADFDFDDQDDDVRSVSVTSQPRKSTRTPLRVSARTQRPVPTPTSERRADHVDVGIGKARSWANFEKFPIDFGISPLPSGLYCCPDSYIGKGSLVDLINLLRGGNEGQGVPQPVSAYSVELRDDMAPAAITSVVDVVFDGVQGSTMSFVNGITSDHPSTAPLLFLGRYLTVRRSATDGDTVALRLACAQAISTLSEQLDRIVLGNKVTSTVRNVLLSARIVLLDLACRTCISTSRHSGTSPVATCGLGLLEQLLTFGFDRAIRPLKRILKGESDSAEIDDLLPMAWVIVRHVLDTWSSSTSRPDEAFLSCLEKAIEVRYPPEEMGPIAAERIWFLVFGLCGISQFEVNGRISAIFLPEPRWQLVKRAIGLIKISHNEEAEERAHIDQLQGRDRYIRTMIARCVRLSAIWRWSFDRDTFSVATKDLGVIFKDRQHRNLPTEPPVDYPDFITQFDMTLTAGEDTRGETAFELYLRLVCVAASDLIGSAQSLTEAQQAEKDVQRLIMSIIPVSPVKFDRILPPTMRQVGQLINRYSTMIAACYFSPSLLPWLLANSRKWIAFDIADFESRQITIRGLMYLAVACRHHGSSKGLSSVVDTLAGFLVTLQAELDSVGKVSRPAQAPSKMEVERTMVLVVVCFRHIIQHHSFDPVAQAKAIYPDACLLHESKSKAMHRPDVND